jgi:hypothetical protein
MTFALYDAKIQQKISANFNWIPNYELLVGCNNGCSGMSKSSSIMQMNQQQQPLNGSLSNHHHHHTSSKSTSSAAYANVFSLDGKLLFDNPDVSLLNQHTELKHLCLNKISKVNALFPFFFFLFCSVLFVDLNFF